LRILTFLTVKSGQNHLAIELNEGRVFELGTGMCPSPRRDWLKQLIAHHFIEEFVEVPLDRLDRLLEHKEHDDRKS
jgi:hypothetical protein